MASKIAENFNRLKQEIAGTCQRCGRRPEDINIVWVSKTKPREMILEAVRAGATIFGENKVQEAVDKFPLPPGYSPSLHFIGRLQSNKVRKILSLCQVVHSVDSTKLLSKINRISMELGIFPEVFLQLNVSGELSKAGFSPKAFFRALPALQEFQHIIIKGLMTLAPWDANTEKSRPVFRHTAEILAEARDRVDLSGPPFRPMDSLSMGMSGDFHIAIEEGSHYIRIGTKLFGAR
jgi:pyridoxal phosphate enzyme (YggS family)